MRFEVGERGPTPKEALDYFAAKKLAPDLDLDEVYDEEHGYAFAVAGAMERDILDGIYGAVRTALADGLTYSTFADGLDEILDRLGWWVGEGSEKTAPHRLRVVYDTNMRVARAAGQWSRVQRTKGALPYLVYSLGPSVRHRPEHEAWAGTVLPVDHSFWSSHMPPNGFGCKCRVRQISKGEAEDLGVSSEVPAGEPDEGWARNPGEGLQPPV